MNLKLAGCTKIGLLSLALISSSFAADDPSPRLTGPRLFPAKTLAYVRIDDVKQLKQDLEKSSLGKLSNDNQLQPILAEFYGSLVRNTQQMQEAIGLNLDELLSIPSGEMAIALLPSSRGTAQVDREESEDGQRVNVRVTAPVIAMLIDAGEEISSIQILLQRMETATANEMEHEQKAVDRLTLHRYQNPNRAQQQFAYFIDNGTMIACSDTNYIEDLAQVWLGNGGDRETLADNLQFTSIMSRCVGTDGERPQVSFYADPMAMIRQFTPKNAATTMTLAMLPALGLDGIEALGGSWIVAPPDFDSISHLHLLLSSPRRAVLSLLRPKSGSTNPEPWVPDSVAAYSTLNWDWQSTLQGVERLFNQFRGEDALEQQVFARANERVGFDVRKDVIENMEGRVSLLQGFVRPVTINSGSNVYAIRFKDIDRIEKTVIPKLMELVERRTEVKTESFGKIKARVIVVQQRMPEGSTIRTPEICVAIIDDYVVISDSRYMMRQLADVQNGTTDRLGEALEFQLISDRITAQLQDKKASAISYARPEESLQLFYELARDPKNKDRLRQLSDNNPFFQALLSALDKHELPPFSVISKYLAPGGGFLVEEETGLHYMSFSLRRE